MKVCIYGAGAIGGWLGVALAQAGHPVSMVARGDTLRALQADGLRMRRADGSLAQVAVTAHSDPAALGVQDLVVVAVKAPGLPDVARAMAPLLGPDTVVLTAMNGVPWWFLDGFGGAAQGRALESVDAGGVIAQAIPARNVVGSVVHTSCSLEAPGFVKQHFGNRLIVGEPDGSQSARLQALADTLQRGGIDVEVSSCIQKDIWFKLWGNLTMNPISALTGATTDRILDDDLVRGFVSAVMLEAKAIGEKLGLPIDQQPEDRHAVTRKLGAFKTSMLQDVEANKPMEIDALVGAVRELGQITAVPTPHTDALLGLVSALQAVCGRPAPRQAHDYAAARRAREYMDDSLEQPITLDDLAALTELVMELMDVEADFEPDQRKQENGIRLILEQPNRGRIFVLRNDHRIFGMVNLLFTISTAEGGFVILMEDFIIHPQHRGTGHGGRLMDYVMDFAREKNFKRITLLTDRISNVSQKFFERHGFTHSAMIPMRRVF